MNDNFCNCGGNHTPPMLYPPPPNYPYMRPTCDSYGHCDCGHHCPDQQTPVTPSQQFPVSGSMQGSGCVVTGAYPYLFDTTMTTYGLVLNYSESVYTRISQRPDPSCINLTGTLDMTDTTYPNNVRYEFLKNNIDTNFESLKGNLPVMKDTLRFRIYYTVYDSKGGIVHTANVDAETKNIALHYTDIKDLFVNSVKTCVIDNIPAMTYSGLYKIKINKVDAYARVVDTNKHLMDTVNPFYQFTNNNTKIVLQNETISNTETDSEILIASCEPNQTFDYIANVSNRLRFSFTAFLSMMIVCGDTAEICDKLNNPTHFSLQKLQTEVDSLTEASVDLRTDVNGLNEENETIKENVSSLQDEVGVGKIDIIDQNLKRYNCFSLVNEKDAKGGNEITFTWSDNFNCVVAGTTTKAARFCNLVFNLNELPAGIKAGGKLYLTYTSTDPNVSIRCLFYKNGTMTGSEYYSESGVINIPDDITGIVIRVNVMPNKTVNGSIYVDIVTTKTNEELVEDIEKTNELALISRDVLPTNTDVNSVTNNGVWLIDSRYTYTNLPANETSGFLTSITTAGWTYQEYSAFSSVNVYKRRGKGESWSDWKMLTQKTYPTSGKYVAFGDSLTWGAVWGPTPGVHYTQADEDYRIPTRIALAVGMESNFENKGSSGAGYVKVGSAGDTITGNVAEYDFTGVSLITVMGGANDKSHINLGTSDATADDGTICGAIKSIIDHVKTYAPKAKLVIIQPTPSGSNSINDIWNGKEAGGWSLNDFDREVSVLCYNNHVGYVNWWESIYCDNWKTHSGGYNMSTGPNYSHPKIAKDYAIIGDFIGGKVSACISDKSGILLNDIKTNYIEPINRQNRFNCTNLLPTTLPNKEYNELKFEYVDGMYHVYGTPTASTRFVEIDGSVSTTPSWFVPGRKVYIKFSTKTALFLGIRYFTDEKPSGDWLIQVKEDTSFIIPDVSQYVGVALRLQIPKQPSGTTIDEYVTIGVLDSMSNDELTRRVEELTPPKKTYPPLFTLIDDDGDKHFLSDIVPIIEEKQVPIASAVSWHFLSQGEGYTADTDTPSPTGKKPRWMDWEQVEEAYGRGAEILNHTYRHLAGSVASQKTVTDLSYNYGRMKNRLNIHGINGSDIIVFSSSSGNYENAQQAASYVGKAAIKIGGNIPNTPDSNIYALSRYRIDYASTEGGTDWDYNAMKTWVDNCATNGGWMIGMFHTSNEIYRHAVAVDESGNAKYDGEGKLLVLYYTSGESGATVELPIGQTTNLNRVFGDDGGVTLTVGKVLYVPMLRNIIDYAKEKGVTICTAEYALKTYYGV